MDSAKRKLSLSEVNTLLNRKSERTNITAPTASDSAYRNSALDLLYLLDKRINECTVGGVVVVATKRPDADNMYIHPKDGFVPCGWVSRSWLNEQLVQEKKGGK